MPFDNISWVTPSDNSATGFVNEKFIESISKSWDTWRNNPFSESSIFILLIYSYFGLGPLFDASVYTSFITFCIFVDDI